MIGDDATNKGGLVFLPDKSVSTFTPGFPTFLGVVNTYGQPECLHTDNASEFPHTEFQSLMYENIIHRESTYVDGPKRNGRTERKVGVVDE